MKFNHLKIALLNNDIVRFEYSPNDNFTDQETLFVENKIANDTQPEFVGKGKISFRINDFEFAFDENDPLNTLEVKKDNKVVYRYFDIPNSGELPLPNKTPEVFPLMDSPRLIIPSEGYSPNAKFNAEENVKDLYLLLCNKDYLKLRKQYISLTGINEMPKIKNFGLFASRYFAHSQKSAIEMIKNYAKHNLPLDTFVVDTDWRDMDQLEGCGYVINQKLFPNMEEFFRVAHKNNVQVLMNDHPLPLTKESTVFDKEEIEYRTTNLQKMYGLGLDGWWYDRNWSCKLNSISKNIASETLGNYLYNDITNQFNLGFVLDPQVRDRNFVMSNVLNIENGTYRSILDSRSHKYSLQWSGDTYSTKENLRNEIVNMNNCAKNMVAYYSSDIGGHVGEPTKKEYVRWFEYGAFSPVLRPHCTCSVKKFREPWVYDKKTLDICRDYVNMRYRLLNVFYTAAFKNVSNGLGICSPLSLYYPNDKRAYKEDASYIIDNKILVSPVTDAGKPISLLSKDFEKHLKLTIYPNGDFKGPISYTKTVKSFTDINKFFKEVKAKNRKVKSFSFRYKGEIYSKSDLWLAINDNLPAKVIIDNKEVLDGSKFHYQTIHQLGKLSKKRHHKLVVEVVQNRKYVPVDVTYYKIPRNNKSKIYLPEGEWFNAFHKNVYQGHRYVKEKFKLEETPIFVKAGTLLALYRKVDNISNMSLKTVVYDYYTSKKEVVNDFFYEDDGKTMSYTIDEYRKNNYKTHFKDDRYIVEFEGNNKLLDDEVKVRDVFFKAHIRDNETIDKVFINGEPIKFKRHDHLRRATPFLDDKFAKDSKTLTFKFRQVIKENYKIEFVLRQK